MHVLLFWLLRTSHTTHTHTHTQIQKLIKNIVEKFGNSNTVISGIIPLRRPVPTHSCPQPLNSGPKHLSQPHHCARDPAISLPVPASYLPAPISYDPEKGREGEGPLYTLTRVS